MQKFTIVGAGASGLGIAYQLKNQYPDLLIIEKARSVGGRMATRRVNNLTFDHGAQFVKPATLPEPFLSFWTKQKNLKLWFESGGQLYWACSGGMNALAKSLAENLAPNIKLNTKIIRIEKKINHWILFTDTEARLETESLILTAPLPQILELLKNSDLKYPLALETITYFKAIVGLFKGQVASPGIQFFDFQNPLLTTPRPTSQIVNVSVQNSKGLCVDPAFAVTMNGDFSDELFDSQDSQIGDKIYQQVEEQFGPSDCELVSLKKWRYSHPIKTFAEAYFDLGDGLFLAGDAFGGASVAGALRSSISLSSFILSGRPTARL